eukprot:Polyplicarium_translucidae@DN3222_c3_g1_i4.p2
MGGGTGMTTGTIGTATTNGIIGITSGGAGIPTYGGRGCGGGHSPGGRGRSGGHSPGGGIVRPAAFCTTPRNVVVLIQLFAVKRSELSVNGPAPHTPRPTWLARILLD